MVGSWGAPRGDGVRTQHRALVAPARVRKVTTPTAQDDWP
jgi:hypothetical protein